MGMFDYFDCEVPLPDGWTPPPGELQTKDFHCMMDTITLTADGRLVAAGRGWTCDLLTQEEHDAARARIADGVAKGLYPKGPPPLSKRISTPEEVAALAYEIEHHGWIGFHGSEPRPEGSNGHIKGGMWCDANWNPVTPYVHHEYRARFSDGRLDRIEVVEQG